MNRILRTCAILGAILLSVSLATESSGELITFQFSGTVTTVVDRDNLEGFDFPGIGDPITGFYRFDSTTPDDVQDPSRGVFNISLPDTALRVLIGNLWLEALSYPIGITQNSYGVGGLIEFTSSPPLPAAIYRTFFGLGVTKDNLFSDPNVLPLSPPSLDGAFEPQMHMTLLGANLMSPRVDIFASLDSLTVVPEPSCLLLVEFALTLLLRIRSRR